MTVFTGLRLRVAILLRSAAVAVEGAKAVPIDAELGAPAIGEESLKYLVDLSSESFKRQVELDESVWRSLPFFAATFAFAAAIAGRAASDLPSLSLSSFSLITNTFSISAFVFLAWALRWIWPVLRKRDYEYPAPDAAIRKYAEEMTEFYAAAGLEGAALDGKVLEELRLFMVDQYGSAAAVNLRQNAIRLAARARVLLFMLVGFVLAFLSEATIFVHRDLYGLPEVKRGSGTPVIQEQQDRAVCDPAREAQGAGGYRRCQLLGLQGQTDGKGEGLMAKDQPSKPGGNASTPAAKPIPPAPQVLAKRDAGLNYGRPRPTPSQPVKPTEKK